MLSFTVNFLTCQYFDIIGSEGEDHMQNDPGKSIHKAINESTTLSDEEKKVFFDIGNGLSDVREAINTTRSDGSRELETFKLTMSSEFHRVEDTITNLDKNLSEKISDLDKNLSKAIEEKGTNIVKWCVGAMVACTLSIVATIITTVIVYTMK